MSSSETSFVPRYIWAVNAAEMAPGVQIAERYQVMSTQIWVDTQPTLPPLVPEVLPEIAIAYLQLFPQRLHVPEVHGFVQLAENTPPILLLENAPLDASGNLYPAIIDVWEQATSVRQLYWLWQILQLWQTLVDLGVATSLLVPENLRVEGWRVRLRELLLDHDDETLKSKDGTTQPSFVPPALAELGQVWSRWVLTAKPAVAIALQALCDRIQAGAELPEIETQINRTLLEQAAHLPLRLQVFGATDIGLQREHNEDACFPLTEMQAPDDLLPQLALVCDGIGGHEGGEVASQLAVQTLKLQVRALLAEVAEQTELVPPELLASQLEASIRVVNNLIASQNDIQGRSARQRMGTTMVLALQLPQCIKTADGSVIGNSHELYLAHVGDSRAYWITPRYCHLLTVDDDVATREVRLGRSPYREALIRPDAGALTQALGTRDAEFLRPTVQRFILEEEGLLLLCSDGLSDNHWIEQFWADYTNGFFRRNRSLEATARALIDLANEKNGYDNTTVVLLHCQVASPQPGIKLPGEAPRDAQSESPLSEASRQLLYPDEAGEPQPMPAPVASQKLPLNPWFVLLGLLALTAIGFAIIWVFLPSATPPVRQTPTPFPEVSP
ncbi:MAG: protein phosphatase 2C domain-containing protein [Scytolyngbya sp. HA4215-MV1]|jgi:protein phosphatase|nr:protein phosphatase 2C domain-containing protein [Scytolyngbya sp. HA4215-MV1]